MTDAANTRGLMFGSAGSQLNRVPVAALARRQMGQNIVENS
jgi:hypothetical protein